MIKICRATHQVLPDRLHPLLPSFGYAQEAPAVQGEYPDVGERSDIGAIRVFLRGKKRMSEGHS
jgi:hypothetical protein